jgi:hypothetical protein
MKKGAKLPTGFISNNKFLRRCIDTSDKNASVYAVAFWLQPKKPVKEFLVF